MDASAFIPTSDILFEELLNIIMESLYRMIIILIYYVLDLATVVLRAIGIILLFLGVIKYIGSGFKGRHISLILKGLIMLILAIMILPYLIKEVINNYLMELIVFPYSLNFSSRLVNVSWCSSSSLNMSSNILAVTISPSSLALYTIFL